MQKLITFLLLSTLVIGFTQAQTIHLLLVSDVENAKFGVTSKADEATILNLMESVKGSLNYTLQATYLNGRQFSTSTVRRELQTLSPGVDDIVFFYFTGSGFYKRRSFSKYPYLKLKGFLQRPISLDEVGNILQSKRARLRIVMADCRENDMELVEISDNIGINESVGFLTYKKLFQEPCGLIKVTSAGKNQRAMGIHDKPIGPISLGRQAPGSVFTRFFSEGIALKARGNFSGLDDLTWEGIFSGTQKRVDEELRIERGEPRPPTAQNAIWDIIECTNAALKNKYKMPSYKNSVDAVGIGYLLEDLLTESNSGKTAELTRRIKGAFVDNAIVEINQSNGFPKSDSRFKSKQVKMSLDNYLEYVITNRSRIKDIGANAYGIKRTKDYAKIITISLFEIAR